MKTLVIDGDIIVHAAASAGEYRYISVEFPDGTLDTFDNRTELKEYCSENDIDYKECIIEDYQFPEPLETIQRTARAMINNLMKEVDADGVEVWVGYDKGFRYDLPLPDEYKGNRKNNIKAIHVDDLKDWILEQPYGRLATDNLEVDDWICIRQYDGYEKYFESDDEFIIGCTTDKDNNHSVGCLYNPNTMSEPRVNHENDLGKLTANKIDKTWKINGFGEVFLLFQMLTSDTVDNLYPSRLAGVRFGPLTAYNYLSEYDDLSEAWKATADKYKEWFGDEFTYTTWDGKEITTNWVGIMDMYYKAFRMKRYPNEDLDVRNELNKHGVEYEEV